MGGDISISHTISFYFSFKKNYYIYIYIDTHTYMIIKGIWSC
jgi:hypothetical protein